MAASPSITRDATAAAPAAAPAPAIPPGETAWLLVVPFAVLTVVAVALLGPPLGSFFTPAPVHFVARGAMPEPTEHARFLIAVLAPLAACGVIALRLRVTVPVSLRKAAVRAAEALVLAFVVFALVAQHVLAFRGRDVELTDHRVYFTTTTLVVAVAIAVGIVATLHRAATAERLRAAVGDTRLLHRSAYLVAVLLVAAWMLTAFNTEASIGRADAAVRDNVPFWLDETFSVLDGLGPLATFHAQYAQLWPYVTAGAMALFGASFGVYATVMVSATSATMLAVLATFRRVTGNALLALALFVPFLATSFFKEQGTLADRYGPANLFSLFPIRYGGPYLLAWLVARHLDRERPRHAIVLSLVGGLVVVNNPEFGAPAFAATLAALVWTLPRRTWRHVAETAGAAAAGVGGALLVTVLVTLAAAGTLPDFGLLFEFSRVYGLDGFGMLPMPTFGFHLAIYVTFAAALVLATVRAVGRADDVVLTGLLCWIGVFGLGAGGYYAGRSHPEVLIDLFSPWAFALALLLVAVVRAIHARPSRWPTMAELAVLLGFGLAACSIGQTPTPWSQIARLGETTQAPRYRPLAIERFVRRHTTPGERVMILTPLGHRIAYDVGVEDAFPYAHLGSVPTADQWDVVFRTVDEQGVRSVFVPTEITHTHLIESRFNETVVGGFAAAGFHATAATSSALRLIQLTR